MQDDPPVRADRLLDREPRELVAERHRAALAAQHARGEARIDLGHLIPQHPVSTHISAFGDTTATASSTPWAGTPSRLPREHGIAHRRGNVGAPAGQHLGDEERIARRALVELTGIDAARARELGDGVVRERRQAQLRHARGRPELSHREADRVARLELVLAIGDDDEGAERLGAPREQPDHVERRLVGPVDVLDHRDRRAHGGQLLE